MEQGIENCKKYLISIENNKDYFWNISQTSWLFFDGCEKRKLESMSDEGHKKITWVECWNMY